MRAVECFFSEGGLNKVVQQNPGTTKATIAKIREKEPNYFCLAKSECPCSVESIRRHRIAARGTTKITFC